MIARLWSARTTKANSTKYLEHFWGSMVPTLRKVDGYLSATVLVRSSGDLVEILVTTIWQSLEAIDKFAAPDRTAAVVAKEAVDLLTDYDRHVRHYEVAQLDGVTFLKS
jgi:heme-degrading monooxygenase HmoA